MIKIYQTYVDDMRKIEAFTTDLHMTNASFKENSTKLIDPLLRYGHGAEFQTIAAAARSSVVNSYVEFANKFDLLQSHQLLLEVKKRVQENGTQEWLAEQAGIHDNAITVIDALEHAISEIYQFVRTRDKSSVAEISSAIDDADSKFSNFHSSLLQLKAIAQELDAPFDNDDLAGKRVIVFHFYNNENDVQGYVSHYKSIATIYEEICEIFSVNDKSLGVIKIESGSYFEKLFGVEQVIKAMSEIMKMSFDLIFRKYTADGKIIRRRELMESISAEIDLVEKCQESGINVTNATKEHIEKSFAIIAGEALALASNSARIRIDEAELAAVHSEKQNYLELGKQLLIGDNQEQDN